MAKGISNTFLSASAEDLPESFLATPRARALCEAVSEGYTVTIDDFIDVIVEYGRMHQTQAFEFDEQSDFLHDNPVFISVPAVRVIARSPTFVTEYARLKGDNEEVSYLRDTVIDDLVRRGDSLAMAEEIVDEAMALASATAEYAGTYDAQLAALSKYETVPSTKDVVTSLTATN